MYVYVDLFLGLNIALNTSVLVLTANLCNAQVRWRRIMVAAMLGALYALVAIYFDAIVLYSVPVKLAASLLMIKIAFRPQTLRGLLQYTASYYLACFVMGGAIAGLYYFNQTSLAALLQPLKSALSMSEMLIGAILAICLLLAVKSGYLTQLWRRSIEYCVEIEYRGRCTTLTAILDTGNALYSICGKPVIVADYQALLPLFSSQVKNFLATHNSEFWLENLHACEDKEWLARVQLIPFRALAGKNLLIAFRPDNVRIRSANSYVETAAAVIGLYGGSLSDTKSYTALLHPAILNLCVHEEVKTCESPG